MLDSAVPEDLVRPTLSAFCDPGSYGKEMLCVTGAFLPWTLFSLAHSNLSLLTLACLLSVERGGVGVRRQATFEEWTLGWKPSSPLHLAAPRCVTAV